MSKRVFATGFALLFLVLSVGIVSAQTSPFVAVYFDRSFQIEDQNPCPGIGVLDTLYVELVNANVFVSGVEFAVNYPPEVAWISDLNTQPATVGQTPIGLSMGWGTPQNGFNIALDVCQVLIMWNCDGCATTDVPIMVLPHPATGTGFVAFTDFPNYDLFPAVGLTSLICATVPAKETTWGQIKSLYGE